MGLLVEAMVRVNRLFPRTSLERRASPDAYTAWEHETGQRVFREHFGADAIQGSRLLDAACGPGGKTAWYAEAGARAVLGVDLVLESLRDGRRFAATRGVADRVRFVAADVTALPLRDGALDGVTANDAMEHFTDPAAALAELARVVRTGGRIFATFPPYCSAWGAHLYDHVRIPWCQVLMPRPLLYAVLARSIEHDLGCGPAAPAPAPDTAWPAGASAAGARSPAPRPAAPIDPAERAHAEFRRAVAFFEDRLNRITVRRFEAIVRAEPTVSLRRMTLVPIKLRWLAPLTRVPGLRELVTAMVAAELERV